MEKGILVFLHFSKTFFFICRYRLNEEKAKCIICLTDVGQLEQFKTFFTVSHLYTWVKWSKKIGESDIDLTFWAFFLWTLLV